MPQCLQFSGWQFIVIIYLGLDFNNISYSIKFSACVTVQSLNDSKIWNASKCITKEIFPLIKNILMILLKVLFIFKGIINKSLYPYVLKVRFEKTLEPPALFVCVERLMLKHYYDNFVPMNFSIYWFYSKKS
jgi:hypothetical protein